MGIARLRLLIVAGVLSMPVSAFAGQQDVGKSANTHAASRPTSSTPDPESLLEQGYRLEKYLSSEERCFHLVRLTEAAAEMHSSKGDALNKRWSEELFRRSLKLPMDWNRVAFQKNALETLAAADASVAFDWFHKMDTPVFTGGRMPPEDLRAFAARTVFARLWLAKGSAALNPILEQARFIGRTGEYPYVAMMPILEQLRRRGEMETFESIFNEAVGFYAQGPHVRNANKEFSEFLNLAWPDVSPPLKQQALNAAVSNLTRKEPDSAALYRGRVVSDQGTVSFNNANMQLLHALMPKVREVDPRWAEHLEEDFPELKQGGGKAKYSSGMTVLHAERISPEQADALGNRRLQGEILKQLQNTDSADPDGAFSLMNSLTDPEFRSEGFSSLASAVVTTDPVRAKQLLSEAEKNEHGIKEPLSRLAALVALAKSAASLHDYTSMNKWMSEAFSLGEELLSEDLDKHPGKAVYSAAGVDQLGALTNIAVQVNFPETMSRLGHLKNEILQAYLLIDGAEGLQKARSAAKIQANANQQPE